MKKVFYYLLLFAVPALITQDANAQAFEKGNINLDLGLGFGAYSTVTSYTTPEYDFGFIVIPPQTVSVKDGAASTMIPLVFEYGISNRIGLGAELGFVNYFIEDSTENDDGSIVMNNTESVKSVDFLIFCNFHLLESDKNDLFIGLGFGGSSVNWEFLNTSETYSGTGGIFKFYIRDRIFFNDHIGLLLNLGYTGYNYTNMSASNGNAFLSELDWSVKGVNFGTGLSVKF